MISGLKCEPTYLMKSILPTSIIYIMDMGKLDKAIDIFKSKGCITNNDLHMISYACIAQIVWEKQPKLNKKKKKEYIESVKDSFSLNSSNFDLFYPLDKTLNCDIFTELILKLGYQNQIFREKILRSLKRRENIAPHYMRNFYLNIEFCDLKESIQMENMIKTINYTSCANITQQLQESISFLVELLESYTENEDKYVVVMICIINSIEKLFPKIFEETCKNKIEKESMILSFSRLLKFVCGNPNFRQNFFFDALIHHFIIAAKLTLKDERMCQISMYAICSCFDTRHQVKYFEHMIGMLVSAYLNYKSNEMIEEVFYQFIVTCTKSKEYYEVFLKTPFIFSEEILQSNSKIAEKIEKLKRYLVKN